MARKKSPYWNPPRIWAENAVYIIGGGPSLIGMDLSPLKSKRVIGVNTAYRDFPGVVDLLWFGDRKFWSDEKPGFFGFKHHIKANFTGLVATCCQGALSLDKEVKKFKRGRHLGMCIHKTKAGMQLKPRYISWNGNSGASAINVAAHLGAKAIVLLGFDMDYSEDGKKNYHNHYKSEKAAVNFKEHKRGFPEIKRNADMLGIEIVNANPLSAIDVFPKMTFEKALESY